MKRGLRTPSMGVGEDGEGFGEVSTAEYKDEAMGELKEVGVLGESFPLVLALLGLGSPLLKIKFLLV